MSLVFDVLLEKLMLVIQHGLLRFTVKGPVLAIILRAPLLCCFGFHRSEASIVIKEFFSGHKQKPQNFQHHKSGGQEIAVCNAQWAIPGL